MNIRSEVSNFYHIIFLFLLSPYILLLPYFSAERIHFRRIQLGLVNR